MKSPAKKHSAAARKAPGIGMTDRQLMKALRRAKPEKYADPCQPDVTASLSAAGESAPPGEDAGPTARTEQEDRAFEEVMATAGCVIGPEHVAAKFRSRDVKKLFCEAVGVKNEEIASRLITQIGNLMDHPQSDSDFAKLTAAIAMMQEIKPVNVTEAMLACQMVGVNSAAMRFVHLATLPGQTLEGMEATANLAIRMMRLYTGQLEALAKLRGTAGQQRVVVEHVTVQDGGHAIVGAVVVPKANGGGGV